MDLYFFFCCSHIRQRFKILFTKNVLFFLASFRFVHHLQMQVLLRYDLHYGSYKFVNKTNEKKNHLWYKMNLICKPDLGPLQLMACDRDVIVLDVIFLLDHKFWIAIKTFQSFNPDIHELAHHDSAAFCLKTLPNVAFLLFFSSLFFSLMLRV